MFICGIYLLSIAKSYVVGKLNRFPDTITCNRDIAEN